MIKILSQSRICQTIWYMSKLSEFGSDPMDEYSLPHTLFTPELTVPMIDESIHRSKEKRFFIRKAIGWALREISQVEPETVFKFVGHYKDRMSGLTFRESSRKLPVKFRNLLG